MNKRFCLIVCVFMFSHMLILIWDKGRIARSGRCDYESGRFLFLIVMISVRAADFVIPPAGAMGGDVSAGGVVETR